MEFYYLRALLIPNQIETQELDFPLLKEKGIRLSIKRLDQVHPLASGNKFFKLKYNLIEAQRLRKSVLLTFGGAYSNHIFAVAAAAKKLGFDAIGVIRGDEHHPLNPTLSFAQSCGMQLHYMNREDYRRKNDVEIINKLEGEFGDFYVIPEGGTNQLAIQGTKEILNKLTSDFSHITTSIGTGGTFAGLMDSIAPHQKLLGFSALKGDFIFDEISKLLSKFNINPSGDYQIFNQFHFGGYGKTNLELIDFIRWFYSQFQIPLDQVYTGKMMFGIMELIREDFFPIGSHLLALHTGGLQGIAGFNQKFGTALPL
ncbi:1-aminocyclopropane-1-carboxylate deaminase/D-cysteine desulfhydrase [Aquiflexum sp.]|uniref:1-aminocyclopropane-1-carboxylate deaminase/D-cysteine desulfhydrase n=1 Tax=Aquiflexum sp. TaxID=1872584 RepID=UPI003593D0C8